MQIFLLVMGVSTDILACAVVFAAAGITLRPKCAFIIAAISTLSLFLAFALSALPLFVNIRRLASVIGGIFLILFGIFTVCEKQFAGLLMRRKDKSSRILAIFSDKSSADADHSKEISLKESLTLGLALALDSFVTGLSAASAMSISQKSLAVILTLAVGLIFLTFGKLLGGVIFRKLRKSPDISAFGGVFLVLLGITQLL